jgi:hypothetical protein
VELVCAGREANAHLALVMVEDDFRVFLGDFEAFMQTQWLMEENVKVRHITAVGLCVTHGLTGQMAAGGSVSPELTCASSRLAKLVPHPPTTHPRLFELSTLQSRSEDMQIF